ncbi:MAG: Ig-like domain-containing protein [Clostridia bacterium]|nr:Ig-like domain-containing protein [Clostridia bacterium]
MKNIRKLLSLLLVLVLAVGLVLGFTACTPDEEPDDEGDDKITYNVTVKDQYGAAVVGAKVQLYLDGVAPVGKEAATDGEGKASFSLKEGNYLVKLNGVPEGYELSTGVVAISGGEATVVVNKHPTYTVYVKDASGAPIKGAAVQICSLSGSCQLPKMTDDEGKIQSVLPSDGYKAKIVSAAGYVLPTENEGYINFDGETLTIVLEAAK